MISILEERKGRAMTYMKRLWLDEDGPTAVEYAVMLALILAAFIAVQAVGGVTSIGFNKSVQGWGPTGYTGS
jgi:Flp pilus assembly pilin Flp